MLKIQNIAVLCILLLCGSSLMSQHTFSIVAIDPVTQEIGSAGATCLTSGDCGGCGGAIVISELLPGIGAANAQATVCLPNVNAAYIADQLTAGSTAQEALSSVLSNDQCQFGNTSERQYGIVSIIGGVIDVASFTGESALSHAGHRTGDHYSIQGNILLGPEILDSMETRYLRALDNGLSLAERLMEAMQGANVVGADSRCAPDGLSSKSAYLTTTFLTDDDTQTAIVTDTAPGVDPIDSLQTLVDNFGTISSVDDLVDFENLSITPNPATDHLMIDNATVIETYQIMTANGKLVQQGRINQGYVPLIALNNGVYIIKLMTKENVHSEKILIQR